MYTMNTICVPCISYEGCCAKFLALGQKLLQWVPLTSWSSPQPEIFRFHELSSAFLNPTLF